jgi:hypothetical protein
MVAWKPFRHPLARVTGDGRVTVGTTVTIWIDEDEKLVKRVYDPQGTTVSGQAPLIRHPALLRRFFQNELYWLQKLEGSRFIPRLVDVDREALAIIQEYAGPDLYTDLRQGRRPPDDLLLSQLVAMYEEYREVGLLKRNGEPRNLAWHNDRLLAFDFKYAIPRRVEDLDTELASIRHFLMPLHAELPRMLMATFDDLLGP